MTFLRAACVLVCLASVPAQTAAARQQVVDTPPDADAPVETEIVEPQPVRIDIPPYEYPIPLIQSPPPSLARQVRRMLEAAMRTEDSAAVAAVVKFALETQPYDKAEIKDMHRTYLDRRARSAAAKTKEETDRIRAAGVFELWKGQVEAGAFRNTGNTTNFGFTAGVKLNRKGIDWEHAVVLSMDYQKDSDTVTREQYGASYQPRYTLNDGLFTYGRAQFERDQIQGFNARFSVSGGLGYRVIERPRMTLSVEAGPALRRTYYTGAPNETTWSGLTSLDFDWKINQTLKLTQDATSYVGSDDSTITSLTALEAGVARGLKAKVSYAIEHETSPPIGSLKTDTTSRFTLVYGF